MTRLGVAGAVVDGRYVPGDMAVQDGMVTAVGLVGDGRGLALPAFVDLQVNGFAGVDFLTCGVEGWREAARALAASGVRAFLPTLITAPPDMTSAAMQVAAEAMRTQPRVGAQILGLHLEGPYLSGKRAGTHPLSALQDFDGSSALTVLADPLVKMVTLAPELPGAPDVIRALRGRDVVVSLGHSDATAVEAQEGFDAGARSVTHLFNAMRPLTAREPGLAGVALTRPDVIVQLICDGVHLADETIRLVIAAAGERLCLVTDAIAAAQVGDGPVRLGDVQIEVRGMEARRSDGTLAGSVLTMPAAVRNLVAAGTTLEGACAAASARPTELLGLKPQTLAPGTQADVVIVDDNLELSSVLLGGTHIEL